MVGIPRERVELRFPKYLLEEVDEYKQRQGLPTRAAAIYDLIRKGLEFNRREQEKRRGDD